MIAQLERTGRLSVCGMLVYVLLVSVHLVRCDEEDGRVNSQCDQHQAKCMPMRAHTVLQGVFEDAQTDKIQNALFCLNRCVRPVDLRSVFGPRMIRLNWDLMEAKLAEQNLGAMTDFDVLKANELMAREAAAEEGKEGNNGNAFGHFIAKRQIAHDDECLKEEIGMALEDAIAECQASQAGLFFSRVKRNSAHDKAIKMEMKELFMLKYSTAVISHFCPQSEEVINWCIATAMDGAELPTDVATADELKMLYCDSHAECNTLANGCVEERTSDVVEMCECFRKLYNTVQTSECLGAKRAFDRIPGQCGNKFMNAIQEFAIDDHEDCAAGAPVMTESDVIELLGGELE